MSLFVITGARGELGQQIIPLLNADSHQYLLWTPSMIIPKGAIVLHFAARHPHHQTSQIIESNLNFLKLVIEQAKGKAAHFVFISSTSVYGKSANGLVSEEYVGSNIDCYGMSKLIGEQLLAESRIASTSLRCPAILELNNSYNFMSLMFDKLSTGESLNLYNAEKLYNCFVTAKVIWQAIKTTIEVGSIQSSVFNIAVPKIMTLLEIADVMKQSIGSNASISNEVMSHRPICHVDTQLISQELGLQFDFKADDLSDWCKTRLGKNRNLI